MANEILIPMDVTIVVYITPSTNMQVLLLCFRTLAAIQLQTETLSNNVKVDHTYSTNIREKNSFILTFSPKRIHQCKHSSKFVSTGCNAPRSSAAISCRNCWTQVLYSFKAGRTNLIGTVAGSTRSGCSISRRSF